MINHRKIYLLNKNKSIDFFISKDNLLGHLVFSLKFNPFLYNIYFAEEGYDDLNKKSKCTKNK